MTSVEESAQFDPMIGTTIGRFVIRTKLAEGGMGAVYLAIHERMPDVRKVVKILLQQFSRNEQIRQRFEREALAASRIKHRHVITIDDFGALPDGQLFLVMPFLEGRPLDAHLREHGKLTLHHTFHIMAQVLDALQCLHDHGIVHRDLKPGNIFVQHAAENAYDIKLIDLGIAHDAADAVNDLKTQTGAVMGTPGYMAVEQYSDAGNVTAAADVYSAGIMAWEMLAGVGSLPWGSYDPRVLFHLQMTQLPVPPADQGWPPELVALLQRCLAIRPGDRFESARAFAFAFAALVPAIPPNVPSGAQILAQVAPDLVRSTSPGSDPFGQHPSGAFSDPSMLPYRGTSVPASRGDGQSAPMGTPVAALSLNPSSHITMAPKARSGAKIAVLGLLVAVVTGVVMFFALHKGHTEAARAPTANADAAIQAAKAPPRAAPDAAVVAPALIPPPPTPTPVTPPPPPSPPPPPPPPTPTATGSAAIHHDHPAKPHATAAHGTKLKTPARGSNAQFDPDAAE
ncbi:MAG: serine/threonine-protein kinase [Kofleriaceae bacterium]